ncbi:hypothetical protein [Psychroflexus tropicus]|uniref:hypothetical protein n=1 Tax=Psychroflexus tropicus TaxID=197345 RepID=UPI000382E777|nr:hypothetical protein [Psychroflexus tropicus]
MKNFIWSIAILCGFIWQASAQTTGERIKQLKTAFITQELSLTTKEAQEFWPIYDQYYEALEQYRKQQLVDMLLGGEQRNEALTEEEARKIVADYKNTETAIYQAEMDLIKNLRQVISEVKIARLLIAEKEFNKRMLQRYRRRK